MKRLTTILILSLCLLTIAAPTATADLEEWFVFDRDPPFYDGEAVRVCTADGVEAENGRMSISSRGYGPVLGTRNYDISPPAGSGPSQPANYELDDEDCFMWVLNNTQVGYQGPGTYALNYTDAQLGNNDRLILVAVLDVPVANTTAGTTTTTTATLAGPAVDTFSEFGEKAFWLAFALVFLFNGWVISGTFFILGAILQEIESGFAVSEAWLFVMAVGFVIIEWLVYTYLPKFHAKIRGLGRASA